MGGSMYSPFQGPAQIPAGLSVDVTAAVAEDEILFFDSNGDAAPLASGTDPGAVCAGVSYPTRSAVAGGQAQLWNGVGTIPQSTASGDSFAASDRCAVAYGVTSTTIGKKAVTAAGAARPVSGVVFGVDEEGRPIALLGEVGFILGRALASLNNKLLGWFTHPVDALAATETAEKTIVREPVAATVTAIYFDTMGTVAADNTDYIVAKVYKADGAGGTHVEIGSYDSRAANQGAIAAGVPKAFSLSAIAGALNLLPTDILTYDVDKQGAGKIFPAGIVRVVGKAR